MEAMIDEAIRAGVFPPHLRGHLERYASFGEAELADYIAEAAAARAAYEAEEARKGATQGATSRTNAERK